MTLKYSCYICDQAYQAYALELNVKFTLLDILDKQLLGLG